MVKVFLSCNILAYYKYYSFLVFLVFRFFRPQVFIVIDYIVMILGIYRAPLDNSLVAEWATLFRNKVHRTFIYRISCQHPQLSMFVFLFSDGYDSPCCKDCLYTNTTGSKCRDADPTNCKDNTYCDGTSPRCPLAPSMSDGTRCIDR